MSDMYGEYDWWEPDNTVTPEIDPYDRRYYFNPTDQPGQGLGNTPGTPDVSFIPVSDQSKGLTVKDVLDFLKTPAGKALGALGLSAVSRWLGLGGTGSPPITGYQGGVPLYNASRTQYATQPYAGQVGSVTDDQLLTYLKQPHLKDQHVAQFMASNGVSADRVATLTGLPVSEINSRYSAAFGPNQMMPRRPGAGGVTYFSPMTYTDLGVEPKNASGFTRSAATGAATKPADITDPSYTDYVNPDLHGAGMAAGGIASINNPRYANHLRGQQNAANIPVKVAAPPPAVNLRPDIKDFGGGHDPEGMLRFFTALQDYDRANPSTASYNPGTGQDWFNRETNKWVPSARTLQTQADAVTRNKTYDAPYEAAYRKEYDRLLKLNPNSSLPNYKPPVDIQKIIASLNAPPGWAPTNWYPKMAAGGIASLPPRFVEGPGDGTSDGIQALINGKQPARIADGEFVIDARTVSEIGNGSSKAGAQKLYAMMDRVNSARRSAKQGKPSNADKYLPA